MLNVSVYHRYVYIGKYAYRIGTVLDFRHPPGLLGHIPPEEGGTTLI